MTRTRSHERARAASASRNGARCRRRPRTRVAQRLEEPLRRAPFPRRTLLVARQQLFEERDELPQLGLRLQQAPAVARLEDRIAQVALHGVARQPRLASDPADALALHEVPPPDLADRLHRYHPRFSPRQEARRSITPGVVR